jgi:hypothetical protein
MTPQQQEAQHRQQILDDPKTSEMVKRAMMRFWQKIDELECDCGANVTGKWALIHSKDCAVFKSAVATRKK